MKKIVKVLILVVAILLLCVSCHECSVCGKKKLNTEKKSFLGAEYYVCKDCINAPAEAIDKLKDDISSAAEDIKKGVNDAVDSIKGIFN